MAQPLDDGAGDEASAALDAVVEEAVGAEDSVEAAEETADEMLADSLLAEYYPFVREIPADRYVHVDGQEIMVVQDKDVLFQVEERVRVIVTGGAYRIQKL